MSPEYVPSYPRKARRGKVRKVMGRAAFVLTAMLAVFLLLATLYGQIRLTALNDEAVSISASIEQQRKLQAKLRIEHESIYDLTLVEEYARQELGMERPRGEQLQYLEIRLPDQVTIYPRKEGLFSGRGISLLDSIASCFSG